MAGKLITLSQLRERGRGGERVHGVQGGARRVLAEAVRVSVCVRECVNCLICTQCRRKCLLISLSLVFSGIWQRDENDEEEEEEEDEEA